MERKLASVQRIAEVAPIDGADSIEAVRVNGWWVVAKKGEFEVGDWCVYFEIDSWVPTDVAPFLTKNAAKPRSYNGIEGERLKTVKLRGQISQGLVLPITQFTHFPMCDEDEGKDVTENLRVQKWEAPVNAQLIGVSKNPRLITLPSFLRVTDQERVQNLKKELQQAIDRDETFEVTLKLDGSSVTVYLKDGEMGVCSRKVDLLVSPENSGNAFIKTAIDTGLFDAVKQYGKNIAVQGELMGPSVQGNREKLEKLDIYIFDVWDIDKVRYLTPQERDRVIQSLVALGCKCKTVPVMTFSSSLVPATNFSLFGYDIPSILELAEGPSLNNDIREGLVFKSNQSSFSFKAISNKYLLYKH